MSTSRVTTSGFMVSTLLSAKSPSMAVPITSISGSRSSRFDINFRITAESSTTRTLIFRSCNCILPLFAAFISFVPDGLAEHHLRVHDQHHTPVAEDRSARQRIVMHPAVVQRLDHQLLI